MALRLKLDENIPGRVEPSLREPGHDVESAGSEGLAGAQDRELVAACMAEQRVLLTLDLDFADIRAYPPGSDRGIWVLRPAQQSFAAVLDLALAGVRLSSSERTAGQLWVIDEQRVRIRE